MTLVTHSKGNKELKCFSIYTHVLAQGMADSRCLNSPLDITMICQWKMSS